MQVVQTIAPSAVVQQPLSLDRAAPSHAAAALTATVPAGSREVHSLRGLFRYAAAATHVALARLDAEANRIFEGTGHVDRAYALMEDMAAVTHAVSLWQRAALALHKERPRPSPLSHEEHPLSRHDATTAPSPPLPVDDAMAARAVASDSLGKELVATARIAHARLADAMTSAEGPGCGAALAAVGATLTAFADWQRACVAYDAEVFIPWVASTFTPAQASRAMHEGLLGGAVVSLREAASVVRWVLRNQADLTSK